MDRNFSLVQRLTRWGTVLRTRIKALLIASLEYLTELGDKLEERAQKLRTHLKSRHKKAIKVFKHGIAPYLEHETSQAYKLRLARRTLWFGFTINVLFGFILGIRSGVYTVTFRQQYGVGIYVLQIAYTVVMLGLNVWLASMADGSVGRRKMYTVGIITLIVSGLVHTIGNFPAAVLGELLFGFAMAAITGILSAYISWCLKELQGADYRTQNREISDMISSRQVIFTLSATISGTSLTSSNPIVTWASMSIAGVLILLTSYYVMFFRKIKTGKRIPKDTTPRKVRSIAKDEIHDNKRLSRYFWLGAVQQSTWALVAVAWYVLYSRSNIAVSIEYVAPVTMAAISVGFFWMYILERRPKYRYISGIDTGVPDDEDLLAEHQSILDFWWIRNANLLGGVLLVTACVLYQHPNMSLILFMMAYITRGMFQRKFAGAIQMSITKPARIASTTILSKYETRASLLQLLAIGFGGLIEHFHWWMGINFMLSGLLMTITGVTLWREERRREVTE